MLYGQRQAGESEGRSLNAFLEADVHRLELSIAGRFRSMSNDVGDITARFSAKETLGEIATLYFSVENARRNDLMTLLSSL